MVPPPAEWGAPLKRRSSPPALGARLVLYCLVVFRLVYHVCQHVAVGIRDIVQWNWSALQRRGKTGHGWLRTRRYTRIPKHVALIAPSYAAAAWGPLVAVKSASLFAKVLAPTREEQVVASIQTLVHLLPHHGLDTISVLLTDAFDTAAFIAMLHAARIGRPLEIMYPFLKNETRFNRPRHFISCANSDGDICRHSAPLPPSLQVLLLDPEVDGRGLVARVLLMRNGELDGPAVEHLLASAMPDAELVIVPLPQLVLLGYPPWSLRVAEIQHERGSCTLTPQRIVRALDHYQGVQQRYGK